MNTVTFHLAKDRIGVKYMSARVVTPLGREFHVGYHPNIGPDGQRDGLNFAFNGQWSGLDFVEATTEESGTIWLEDRSSDDMFCSEMFHDLTGRYPFEIEYLIEPNQDYAPFPGA